MEADVRSAPLVERQPGGNIGPFFGSKMSFGDDEKKTHHRSFFDSVRHHLSMLWLFWASLFS